ncbi:MAG: hypothetical protein J6Y93_01005 [Treponema sp.]|nr:hypothetical protein [Treponema sp.]
MILNMDDGDIIVPVGNGLGMDSEGDLHMRVGEHMSMNMNNGDLHMVSNWEDDDPENCNNFISHLFGFKDK